MTADRRSRKDEGDAERPPGVQLRHARQGRARRLHKTVAPRRENCLFCTSMPRIRRLGRPEAIDMAHLAEPVTIKRYANRRFYHPAGRYVTLADLARMVEDDANSVILDAQSGEHITRSILQQIILGRAKHG
jgi:PHB/PHA accumulation regulator DNA-binding domain